MLEKGEMALRASPENIPVPFAEVVAEEKNLKCVAAVQVLDLFRQAGGKIALDGQFFQKSSDGFGVCSLNVKGRTVFGKDRHHGQRYEGIVRRDPSVIEDSIPKQYVRRRLT